MKAHSSALLQRIAASRNHSFRIPHSALRLCFAVACAVSAQPAPEVPVVNDPTLKVELFAEQPLIKHPIGMTFTADGKLLVIESHTHFRPENYQGPEHDRILWLHGTEGNGRAERADVFFEGTDMTMDIATAPDGRIYVSTRNEILRMSDNNGKAGKVERKLVFLDSESRYPHNGLSGLAFDNKGGLYFGMGENLGMAYTITGSDGMRPGDQSEGGNIFHMTVDGGKLHRVASGFWNPFGVCVDTQGNIFASDNDPDSRPPCRLHHVIEGGDYGYHFRYGRSGLHPFTAWNGELPGTLPMLSGTGEAPCRVIYYAPKGTAQFRGLPTLWHGTLLVASWADHAIESYTLPDHAHAFDGVKKKVLVQGGPDFRPVAFAVADDGSIYVSDWVKRDYELHGHGRVWHISAKESRELKGNYAEVSGITWKQEQLNKTINAKKVTPAIAANWLNDANPWKFSTAIQRIARDADLVKILASNRMAYPRQRAGLLLAVRSLMEAGGKAPVLSPAEFLTDSDATVRLLALKWISDLRLAESKADVERLLKSDNITPELFYGAITTLSRLESAEIKETDLVKRLKERIISADTPNNVKRMALGILPDRDRNLIVHDVAALLQTKDADFKEWLVHVIGTLRDQHREPALRSVAFDEKQPAAVRAAALMHLAITAEDKTALTAMKTGNDAVLERARSLALLEAPVMPDAAKRPPLADIAAWRKLLNKVPGKPDLAHGREVFLSPKLGGCIVCHRVDGIGATAGPDLSNIGAAKEPDYVLESILQPSRNVAPAYECFLLQTTDGQMRTVFQLMERGGTHTYVGLDGKPFEIKIEDIVKRDRLPVSIMPEGLVMKLTDEEVRDLVAWLESKK